MHISHVPRTTSEYLRWKYGWRIFFTHVGLFHPWQFLCHAIIHVVASSNTIKGHCSQLELIASSNFFQFMNAHTHKPRWNWISVKTVRGFSHVLEIMFEYYLQGYNQSRGQPQQLNFIHTIIICILVGGTQEPTLLVARNPGRVRFWWTGGTRSAGWHDAARCGGQLDIRRCYILSAYERGLILRFLCHESYCN